MLFSGGKGGAINVVPIWLTDRLIYRCVLRREPRTVTLLSFPYVFNRFHVGGVRRLSQSAGWKAQGQQGDVNVVSPGLGCTT